MNVALKRDGLTLRGELLLPEKDSYDIAILMHGFTGNRNGELLTALADALLEKGVASVRFDFNGHGDSDGKLEDMTVLNEIADAKVILDYAKSLEHVRNIFLFGHSQGGVVASMIAGYYPEVFNCFFKDAYRCCKNFRPGQVFIRICCFFLVKTDHLPVSAPFV